MNADSLSLLLDTQSCKLFLFFYYVFFKTTSGTVNRIGTFMATKSKGTPIPHEEKISIISVYKIRFNIKRSTWTRR